jgi:DNA-binding Lrp family transcriptional regulator
LDVERLRISPGDFLSYIPHLIHYWKILPHGPNRSKILAELQKDGRLSVTELADRVGLSLSPCHRRLKALEESGAILGYHARLAPSALGLNFAALVFVTLREVTRQPVADFEAALAQIPQIVEAQRLFGDPDYLLHVVAKDLPAFQKLYDEQLTSIPNVKRLSSTW